MYIPNQAQLYEFKFCLINSVTVDWNSAGTAAFYTGTQAPVEVSLALSLIEIGVVDAGRPLPHTRNVGMSNHYFENFRKDNI